MKLHDTCTIAVFGNKDYNEHLPPHLENVRQVLNWGELAELLGNPKELKKTYQNTTYAIIDLLPPTNKDRYSTKEISNLKNLVLQFSECQVYEEREIFCKVCSIVTGKNWISSVIHGSSKLEWQEIFYQSDEWTKEKIESFRREYFNIGG